MRSLAFREAEATDLGFVFQTWLDEFRDSNAAGVIPMPDYYRVYRDVLRFVLKRPGIKLWVAHHPGLSPESKADLHGFACVELGDHVPVIHFVYVKGRRRRKGIARRLLAAMGVDASEPYLYTFRTEFAAKHLALPRDAWRPKWARYSTKDPHAEKYQRRLSHQAGGRKAKDRVPHSETTVEFRRSGNSPRARHTSDLAPGHQ